VEVAWPLFKHLLQERGYDIKRMKGNVRVGGGVSEIVWEEVEGADFRARADALGPESSRLCLRVGAMSAEERELASALLDELRP
jgi:hypothetical protein